MNIEEYYLNEAYKHEDREKEDVYKVYLLFFSDQKWIDSDTDLERLKQSHKEGETELGWIWNTDFNQYNPAQMYKKLCVQTT